MVFNTHIGTSMEWRLQAVSATDGHLLTWNGLSSLIPLICEGHSELMNEYYCLDTLNTFITVVTRMKAARLPRHLPRIILFVGLHSLARTVARLVNLRLRCTL